MGLRTESPEMARNTEILSIQYLRALAAVLVLINHAAAWPLAQEPTALANLGRLGVDVFFIISGFIITVVVGPGPFDPIKLYSAASNASYRSTGWPPSSS